MSTALKFVRNESVAPDVTPVVGDVAAWEKAMRDITNVSRITSENQAYFSMLLSREQDADSYLTSPAYYAFTGRNGLWIYEDEKSFIPFCWHPNILGQILVFPTRGSSSQKPLQNLLEKLPKPPVGLKLARIKDRSESVECTDERFSFAPVIENVLDWKFPVRILSTSLVTKMDGPDFRYIRNHVKHVQKTNPSVSSLYDVPEASLHGFIKEWVSDHSNDKESAQELTSLYKKILSFIDSPGLNVSGFVVIIDDKIEALSMWDVSNPQSLTANRFVNLCNTDKRGLADFTTHCLAQKLYEQGIGYVNVGGAETASLDSFKNKFMPVRSIGLHSVEVVFHENDDMRHLPIHPSLEKAHVRVEQPTFYKSPR